MDEPNETRPDLFDLATSHLPEIVRLAVEQGGRGAVVAEFHGEAMVARFVPIAEIDALELEPEVGATVMEAARTYLTEGVVLAVATRRGEAGTELQTLLIDPSPHRVPNH